MPAKVTRNLKEVTGAVSIELTGDTARVEVETGSELDGLLYYNWTRDGRPRLGLNDAPHQRFKIAHIGGAAYELAPEVGAIHLSPEAEVVTSE